MKQHSFCLISHHTDHSRIAPVFWHYTLKDGTAIRILVLFDRPFRMYYCIRNFSCNESYNITIAVQYLHMCVFKSTVVKSISHYSLNNDTLCYSF